MKVALVNHLGIIVAFFMMVLGSLCVPLGQAYAEYAFTSADSTVTVGTEVTSHTFSHLTDGAAANTGGYYRVIGTSAGFESTLTFDRVDLHSANLLLINYSGYLSGALPTGYQVQIFDYTDNTWRNMVPHNGVLNNTTAPTTGFSTYQFGIYDGYWSTNGTTKITTELSHFVSGNAAKVRFVTTDNASNIELRVDYLSIEPTIDHQYTASGMTVDQGSISANTYADTVTDDNTTNLVFASGTTEAKFIISNVATPYTGANSILIEAGASISSNTYDVYIRDFSGAGSWTRLSSTSLSNSTDITQYFATDRATPVTNFISTGNEIWVRILSSGGTLTVDYIQATVGSVVTSSGNYVGAITRGTTKVDSNTDANTANLDTSKTTPDVWKLYTTLVDARTTTEYYGDCTGTVTNGCLGTNVKVPVTVPSNVTLTGVHTAMRFLTSATSLRMAIGVRNDQTGNIDTNNTYLAPASQTMYMRNLSYPIPPGVTGTLINKLIQPHQLVDTVNNWIELYGRNSASVAAAEYYMNWDFAFASIRYIDAGKTVKTQFTARSGGSTLGQNNASNPKYLLSDDAAYWVLNPDATNGIDATATISGVQKPTGANKLIITTNQKFSLAGTTIDMYIYDFTNALFRKITPHEGKWISGTSDNYGQVELYDGYFSDGSDVPVSTPLDNFISPTNELWVKIKSTSTTSVLSWDWVTAEFAKDPVYYPADSTVNNSGTIGTTEYNDTTTDDATSYTVASGGGNPISVDMVFKNVLTPPTGSNAIFIQLSSNMAAGATSYSLAVSDTGGTGGFSTVNGTTLTNTSDALNYFMITGITDWSRYITNGQMTIRVTSVGAGGSISIDQIRLILGSAPTASDVTYMDIGKTFDNKEQLWTLDTSNTYNARTQTWRIAQFPGTSASRMYDAPSAFSIRQGVSVQLPGSSYPTGIIWNVRAANTSANNTMTLVPQFENGKHYFIDATNTYWWEQTSLTLPATVTAVTLATNAQSFRQGWFVYDLPNIMNTLNNRVMFRWRTSASTNIAANPIFDWDSLFVAIRYVD